MLFAFDVDGAGLTLLFLVVDEILLLLRVELLLFSELFSREVSLLLLLSTKVSSVSRIGEAGSGICSQLSSNLDKPKKVAIATNLFDMLLDFV